MISDDVSDGWAGAAAAWGEEQGEAGITGGLAGRKAWMARTSRAMTIVGGVGRLGWSGWGWPTEGVDGLDDPGHDD